jgi:hypothetical protein
VVAGNKSFAEGVVCMLVSDPKSYTKDQLLIPNSVNEIKGGKTYAAISNFGNEPKTLRAGSMVSFYEKLNDATILVDVTNAAPVFASLLPRASLGHDAPQNVLRLATLDK